jgi:hypothetical protein
MMDKKIQDVSIGDSMSPNRSSSVLGVQRARVEQMSSSGIGSPLGSAATGGISSSQNTSNVHTTPLK